MSFRKGNGKFVAGNVESSSKFSGIAEGPNPKVDQLSEAVEGMRLEGDKWGDCVRKSNNRPAGGSTGKPWASQNSGVKAWGAPDTVQKLCGMQSGGGSGKVPPCNSGPTLDSASRRPQGRGNNSRPQPAIPPPLEHGWNWPRVTAAYNQSSEDPTGQRETTTHLDPHPVDDDGDKTVNDDDSDEVDTDDELLTDEYDSDASEKSHGSRKNSKWFKVFFENLDKLSLEEIHGPTRQWHCPACKGGPGAIDWYRGLQPLITHAKTKGSKRMKLHRDFAELLDEELRRRGTSAIPAGEMFGKWKGLNEMVKDRSIVWPPMVVIMNTKLERDENDKWIGMGNQELLDYFDSYNAVKARHAYGPQGHRGMSVLIFENTAMGFLEAERLHAHFQHERTDRDTWDRCPVLFQPGGKRQLYGYMAEKQDVDLFNKHCQGKNTRLKFETRSYQEMVVDQLRQMSEDNQQLIWFKDKVAKVQRHSKAIEESFGVVSEKLRRTTDENRTVRQRSKMHHEQNKEEMDFQEQFFKDQLKIIHEARDAKEDDFDKIQQEEREKMKQSNSNISASSRDEDFAKFVQSQDKEIDEFVCKREEMMKTYEDKKIEMKQRHWEEEVQMEKDFDTALNQLMDTYTSHQLEKKGTTKIGD